VWIVRQLVLNVLPLFGQSFSRGVTIASWQSFRDEDG
jgi:hypothetical protein